MPPSQTSATLSEPAVPVATPARPAISVLTNVLVAVAKWTSTDHTRLHLRLVVFRDNEMIATDGHRLVRVPCETHGYTLGIDRVHLLAAAHAQRELEVARPHSIDLWPDKRGHVQLRLTGPAGLAVGGEVLMDVPAGKVADYPPIEQVMPEPTSGVSPVGYVMNPRYLAAIDEVTSAMLQDGQRGVTLAAWCAPDEDGDRLGPMLYTNAGGARFVIMPMRAP